MQSLFFIVLFNITAGEVIADLSSPMDVQNGDMSRMAGGGLTTLSDKSDWDCRNERQCLKRGGSTLKIYYDPTTGGQAWHFQDCVSACKQYEGCYAVDIERSATVYWVHKCVLYDFDNWVQNHKDCTKAELWLSFSPKGKSNSRDDEFTKAGELGTDLKKAVEFGNELKKAEELHDWIPSSRDGWSCDIGYKWLELSPLEIFDIAKPQSIQWNVGKCQQKCEEYGDKCIAVDIQAWDIDHYNPERYMSRCILYTSGTSIHPVDQKKDKSWTACLSRPRHPPHALIV